ncbi:hypothetical protein CLOP_g23332 [Closterium sp. NIES-67]|nr:hypothetical protein CLOP_g23332 [Closterium sp. NIES-67]
MSSGPSDRTQWRLTQPELQDLQDQLHYLRAKGFVCPSTSPFAAPILFAPKKDGAFACARYFSKIVLCNDYHQIRVFVDDCPKTVFCTCYISYEYTVMPFGLTNAPSTFQLTMNGVFRDILDKCVIIYLDTRLIDSTKREQHLKDLEALYQRLQQNCVIKGCKCEFLKPEREILGHFISTGSVQIDLRKNRANQEWKSPINLQGLQSLLGFVNYVRRFIPTWGD